MCSNIAMHRPQSAVHAFASSAPAAYTDLRGHELTHDPTGNRQFISLLVGGRLSLNGIFDTLLVLAREYFFQHRCIWVVLCRCGEPPLPSVVV
jgi:hypothetical protein